MKVLDVANLSRFYGDKMVLKSVSMQVDKGEIVALLGPNGAGKTTLLSTIIGIAKPSGHSLEEKKNLISFNKTLINDWSVAKRVECGMVYLPQSSSLFSKLTALQNLQLVYQYHPYWRKMRGDEAQKQFSFQMHKWLKKSDLTNVVHLKCLALSGGQKRKLEIVRALLMQPKIIMFDEPFAGVDPKSIYELKAIFLDLSRSGISVIISDHHVDQLLSIASRIYVIVDGEVVVSGDVREIVENEYTKEMYFGKQFYSEMAKKFLS